MQTEEFFEEYGVPVTPEGEPPDDLEAPELGALAAALERNGVTLIAAPEAAR